MNYHEALAARLCIESGIGYIEPMRQQSPFEWGGISEEERRREIALQELLRQRRERSEEKNQQAA